MARRPNYGAEKRSRELSKQRRKEEKEEKKRQRVEAGEGDEPGGGVMDGEMENDAGGGAG